MSTPPRTPKTEIDWNVVRLRVETAAARLRDSLHADEAWSRETLERRAREMAQPLGQPRPAASIVPVVAFELGGQSFAFEAASVRATVRPREITPLPGLPAFVSGVVNVRSQVVPAFDLRPLLQLPAGAAPDAPTLLIASIEGTDFAVVVDRVLPSVELPADTMRREVPGLNNKYVRGLAADGIIFLDLPALFADLTLHDTPQA